jgi:hypothetical protein
VQALRELKAQKFWLMHVAWTHGKTAREQPAILIPEMNSDLSSTGSHWSARVVNPPPLQAKGTLPSTEPKRVQRQENSCPWNFATSLISGSVVAPCSLLILGLEGPGLALEQHGWSHFSPGDPSGPH